MNRSQIRKKVLLHVLPIFVIDHNWHILSKIMLRDIFSTVVVPVSTFVTSGSFLSIF